MWHDNTRTQIFFSHLLLLHNRFPHFIAWFSFFLFSILTGGWLLCFCVFFSFFYSRSSLCVHSFTLLWRSLRFGRRKILVVVFAGQCQCQMHFTSLSLFYRIGLIISALKEHWTQRFRVYCELHLQIILYYGWIEYERMDGINRNLDKLISEWNW